MTHVSDEISSQPECWSKAAALARDTKGSLPVAGERVAVVGCGTSYNMAAAFACLREGTGNGLTDAMPASELHPRRQYDRYLFLSRSGTTTEVLQALEQVPKGTLTTAITADPTSPIAVEAGATIVLDFAAEQSIVQTRFATSLLVMLRAHLGEDLRTAIDDARRCVDEALPERVLTANRFTFLGRDWTVGVAHEAALKLRESAQAWTESYPATEFRHGPISVIDSGSVVWSFGPPPSDLAEHLRPTGATFLISKGDPLADLIRAQRVGVALAKARGLDPDRPRNLSFSVILG
jgi:fructoselysine-6-P-deglycase FrlB-like protein